MELQVTKLEETRAAIQKQSTQTAAENALLIERVADLQRSLASADSNEAKMERRLAKLKTELAKVTAQNHKLDEQVEDLNQRIVQIKDKRDDVYRQLLAIHDELVYVKQSKAWSITAPLRAGYRVIKRVRQRAGRLAERLLLVPCLRLPNGAFRRRLRDGGFRVFGTVLRGTATYERWRNAPVATIRKRGADDSEDDATTPDPELIDVPASDEPLVSVVIPVHGQIDHTLRCLASIQRRAPQTPIEVVVVDDASPDGTANRLAQVKGIRLLRNQTNLGFIRSCNRAAGPDTSTDTRTNSSTLTQQRPGRRR